jgi:hypothetical protein
VLVCGCLECVPVLSMCLSSVLNVSVRIVCQVCTCICLLVSALSVPLSLVCICLESASVLSVRLSRVSMRLLQCECASVLRVHLP